jgi:hypothetical protein
MQEAGYSPREWLFYLNNGLNELIVVEATSVIAALKSDALLIILALVQKRGINWSLERAKKFIPLGF